MSDDRVDSNEAPQSIIASVVVDDAAKAIDFYKNAFGAEELMRMPGPNDQGVMHAELQIGNSRFFLMDEFSEMSGRSPRTLGGTTGGFYIYVDDVDAMYQRALEAGATEEMAPEDMFWGDRMGSVVDPFGHHWGLATHKEDVPEDELKKRIRAMYEQMAAEQEEEVEASV